MEIHDRNLSEMLPYEKLAVLGIDREKADSLPADVKEKLASGEVTPLLQVSIRAQNGDVITLPLKLQRNKALLFTDQEAERLGKGDVIRKAVEVRGEKVSVGVDLKEPQGIPTGSGQAVAGAGCQVRQCQRGKIQGSQTLNPFPYGQEERRRCRLCPAVQRLEEETSGCDVAFPQRGLL